MIADGAKVRDEQRLTHKMRLQLGGDELLFLDETAAGSRREAPACRRTADQRPRVGHSDGAVAVVAALAVAAWWCLVQRMRASVTRTDSGGVCSGR